MLMRHCRRPTACCSCGAAATLSDPREAILQSLGFLHQQNGRGQVQRALIGGQQVLQHRVALATDRGGPATAPGAPGGAPSVKVCDQNGTPARSPPSGKAGAFQRRISR